MRIQPLTETHSEVALHCPSCAAPVRVLVNHQTHAFSLAAGRNDCWDAHKALVASLSYQALAKDEGLRWHNIVVEGESLLVADMRPFADHD